MKALNLIFCCLLICLPFATHSMMNMLNQLRNLACVRARIFMAQTRLRTQETQLAQLKKEKKGASRIAAHIEFKLNSCQYDSKCNAQKANKALLAKKKHCLELQECIIEAQSKLDEDKSALAQLSQEQSKDSK